MHPFDLSSRAIVIQGGAPCPYILTTDAKPLNVGTDAKCVASERVGLFAAPCVQLVLFLGERCGDAYQCGSKGVRPFDYLFDSHVMVMGVFILFCF